MTATEACTVDANSTVAELMETVYVRKKVSQGTWAQYQKLLGLSADTTILADNYFYSIFPGMLTLFQMLIGARESSLVELLLPNMPCW